MRRKGVFISFSKYVWRIIPMSSHIFTSNVGNLLSANSSPTSTVNTRSSFTEFITGKQILAIRTFVSSFSLISSILASSVMTSFLLAGSNLVPSLKAAPACRPSSTYTSSISGSTPLSARMVLYSSAHCIITSLAAHIVSLAPIGPPSCCLKYLPPNL